MHEGIIPSCGNVFADLGFPYPEEELAKSQLAYRLATIIENRNLSLKDAASLLGISAEDLSLVVTGQFGEFTIDRLMRFLTALGEDVEITVRSTQGNAQLHIALG
ncbi:MAG TPA: helix-turn-helix transcriptional regulator [Ktedonobacteraceae bacterium]|jgi:predicted XRE-type DNA-binding protein